MPALQKAFDHFDALPSSLTGISLLSRFILHAAGETRRLLSFRFCATDLTAILKREGRACPAGKRNGPL